MNYYRLTLTDGVMHYVVAASAKSARAKLKSSCPAAEVASVRKLVGGVA